MISCIIPVFNSESFLDKCIKSIISQTYTDWEILIIDDGSTDKSKMVIDKYLMDSRIHYFFQQNSGVSAARNLGLANAKGDWITFIDSDDWLESNCFATLSKYFFDYEAIRFGYKLEKYGNVEKKILIDMECTGKEIIEMIASGKLEGFSCCWLIKNDKIKNVRFLVDYKLMEDTIYLYTCMLSIKRIKVSAQYFYHYVYHERSATATKKNPFEKYKEYCKSINYLQNNFDDLNIEQEKYDLMKLKVLNDCMQKANINELKCILRSENVQRLVGKTNNFNNDLNLKNRIFFHIVSSQNIYVIFIYVIIMRLLRKLYYVRRKK